MNKLNELDLAELLIIRSLVISDSCAMIIHCRGSNYPENEDDNRAVYDAITQINDDIVLKLSRKIRAMKATKNKDKNHDKL